MKKKIDIKEQKIIKRSWVIFIIVLILTLLSGLLIEPYSKFGFEGEWWFNPIFGFVACVAIIIFSKLLGYFLKRPEDYYGGEK